MRGMPRLYYLVDAQCLRARSFETGPDSGKETVRLRSLSLDEHGRQRDSQAGGSTGMSWLCVMARAVSDQANVRVGGGRARCTHAYGLTACRAMQRVSCPRAHISAVQDLSLCVLSFLTRLL
jgi:hypothetical protein